MSFGERLKNLRENKCLKQVELAKTLNLTSAALSQYEKGIREPNNEILTRIARYFDVSTDYLLEVSNETNVISLKNKKINLKDLSGVRTIDDMVKIPVVGTIRAGVPILVCENIVDYKFVQQEGMQVGEIYFSLEVKGDSMINAGIEEGDFVVVKRQDYIDKEGDIAVVIVNGDEATLKRVYFQPNGIVLQAENPNYPPMLIAESEIKSGYVTIVGKAVKLLKERSL